jgi:hypothetical protein
MIKLRGKRSIPTQWVQHVIGAIAIGALFQVAAVSAYAEKSVVLGGPLLLKDAGSFFVGGEIVNSNYTGGAGVGSYVRKQLYVDYKVPAQKIIRGRSCSCTEVG